MVTTKKVTGYVLTYTNNLGERSSHGRYYKKSQATSELKRVLAPARGNKTSYRDAGAWGGSGVNNPRIKKVRIYR